MNSEQLAEIKSWFTGYLQSFAPEGETIHPMLELKVRHSERVAEEARGLAADLGWPESEQNTAEALGMLHDIGRFPQFAEYGTFSDAVSVDHGECGWSVAERAPVLAALPSPERQQILAGIRHHNARAMPDDLPRDDLRFLELIRDADKLDVFQVVLEAVRRDGFRDLPEMLPHVTLERSCSPQVIEDVRNRRCCSLNDLRSLGDFLVMQLSWVSDINTLPALRRIRDRRIVSQILSQLPQSPALERLGEAVNGYLTERLDGAAS